MIELVNKFEKVIYAVLMIMLMVVLVASHRWTLPWLLLQSLD